MGRPTLRIGDVAAPVRGQDAVDFARGLRESPILDGRFVDVVFAAATTGTANHALRRTYAGAFVVYASAAHASAIMAASPAAARTALVDPALQIYVLASTAYTGTVRLWVF